MPSPKRWASPSLLHAEFIPPSFLSFPTTLSILPLNLHQHITTSSYNSRCFRKQSAWLNCSWPYVIATVFLCPFSKLKVLHSPTCHMPQSFLEFRAFFFPLLQFFTITFIPLHCPISSHLPHVPVKNLTCG